jgi:hypothetical protein
MHNMAYDGRVVVYMPNCFINMEILDNNCAVWAVRSQYER